MGFLDRFRKTSTEDEWLPLDAVRWEPLHYAIARPLGGEIAGNMGDDGQVGRRAWETIFTSPDVTPGAEIAICVYPAQTSESYCRGIRYTYTTPEAPGWSCVMWAQDPYEQPYGDVFEADEGARALAVKVGMFPGLTRAMFHGIFDWDGQRFDTTTHVLDSEI